MLSDTATRATTGVRTLRQPTLDTLGLGSVLDILRGGRLPVSAEEIVEAIFGPPGERGALVNHRGERHRGRGQDLQESLVSNLPSVTARWGAPL